MKPREFLAALAAHDVEAIRSALESDPELASLQRRNPEYGYRETALQIAAGLGDLAIVEALLAADAPVWDMPVGGYPAVVYADDRGHREVVAKLVEASNRTDEGFPPTFGVGIDLINAARNGWVDAVREHLAKDPFAIYRRGCIGEGTLHWPAHNNHLEILTLLLEAGAPVDMEAIGLYGGQPIHWAAEHAPEALQLLLDHGADPMARNRHPETFRQYTPLHMTACQRNECLENARILVEAGADLTALDAAGMTPLEVARSKNHLRMAAELERLAGV